MRLREWHLRFQQQHWLEALILSVGAVLLLSAGTCVLWYLRFKINPDGLSYLEMGERLARGDFESLFNAYWSPGYAFVIAICLKIFSFSEPDSAGMALSVASFVGYVLAMIGFTFFVWSMSQDEQNSKEKLPKWFIYGFSTLIFAVNVFCYNSFILLHNVPDSFVLAFFYFASGFLAQIVFGRQGRRVRVLLGLSLGVGYIFKAIFFPLAGAFLIAHALFELWGSSDKKGKWSKFLPSLIAFSILATPMVVGTSLKSHRLSFGESGRLNYLWFVNRFPRYFTERDQAPSGEVKNPPTIILDSPTVYAYPNPRGVTWPYWYEPATYFDGVNPSFDLNLQARRIGIGLHDLKRILFHDHIYTLLSLLLFGLLTAARRKIRKEHFEKYLLLFFPVVVGIVLYLISVPLESRYLAPFISSMGVIILGITRFPGTKLSQLALCGFFLLSGYQVVSVIDKSLPTYENAESQYVQRLAQAKVLNRMGLNPGDTVGVIFWGFQSQEAFPHWTWTKFAGLKVGAELVNTVDSSAYRRTDNIEQFLFGSNALKAAVIRSLKDHDIKALVGWVPQQFAQQSGLAWKPVPGAKDFYVLFTDQKVGK